MQTGYMLEPLPDAISIKVTSPSINRLEYISAVRADSSILMIDEHRNLIRSTDRGLHWELLYEFIPEYNNLRELVEYGGEVYA